MFKYALLDKNNKCTGISYLSGKVNEPNMIEIAFEDDPVFKIFSNGEWIEDTSSPELIVDETNPIDMLGMVTTQNSLELSELKQQVEAIGQGVVEIMLNQQIGGM